MPREAPMVIDGGCGDTFCSGIARIDKLSGNLLRLVIYSEHPTPGGKEWVVVAKLVLSASAAPTTIRQIALAIGEHSKGGGDFPRLMM